MHLNTAVFIATIGVLSLSNAVQADEAGIRLAQG